MRSLSATDVVEVWEQGLDRDREAQMLLLLRAAWPAASREALAALTIGQRDARVLALRAAILGPDVEAFAECPACAARLEFALATADFPPPAPADLPTEQTLAVPGLAVRFRLPTWDDVAAAGGAGSREDARRCLAERCVVATTDDGTAVRSDALAPDVLTQVADRMAESDPHAEVWLDLTCPTCGHGWRLLFDVASFVWAEISAAARRLLHEVDALARVYGWRERDILDMSCTRRRAYLAMVGA